MINRRYSQKHYQRDRSPFGQSGGGDKAERLAEELLYFSRGQRPAVDTKIVHLRVGPARQGHRADCQSPGSIGISSMPKHEAVQPVHRSAYPDYYWTHK